uniref:Putative 5-Hydroxytryptamine receptor 4 n=1 Tax=Hirudo verbana TaxID=311461 RepID=A0A2S1WLX0_9ANNE|nr:putative 5-Hydroxytryptamine receptor 4 [Hirudo verbana]
MALCLKIYFLIIDFLSDSTRHECQSRRRQSSPCFDHSCYEADCHPDKRRKSSSVLMFERLKRNRSQQLKYNSSKNSHPCNAASNPTLANHSALDYSAMSLSSATKKTRSRSVSQMLGKINSRLKLSSIKSHKTNSERKATRTLGVIMGCFIACWLPFFILALVKPFLGELAGRIPRWLDTVFLWLGYANSLLNPIIYARFNRDFRVPFRYIIQCRCSSINNRMRVSEFAEQFGRSESSFNPNISGRDPSSGVQNSQHRHRLSNIRTSRSTRASVNNRSSLTSPEEQHFLQSTWKNSSESRHTMTDQYSGVVNRTRGLKVDKVKRPQPSQNLVFKRYNPQNKRNNSPISYDVSPREENVGLSSLEATTRLTTLENDRCSMSIDETMVHKQRQLLLFVAPADNINKQRQQQQQLHNCSNNKSSPTKSRPPLNRDDCYQPFIPKAPLINMSMVIDDNDYDDDEEEEEDDDDDKNSLRVVAEEDDDDDDDDNYDGGKNLNMSGKSTLEPRFPMLDNSSTDLASNCSNHEDFFGRQESDLSSERNNGILKVFTTSFNEMNKEHSFVI